MARDLTIVCGRYVVPWDIFLFMSSIVECCQSLIYTSGIHEIFPSTPWNECIDTSIQRGALVVGFGSKQDDVSPLRLAQWRVECQREGRLSMVSALSLSRNQKATDARDKVFCVLAFSPIEHKDSSGIQSIKPDYSLSLAKLYIEVAKSLVAAYGPCILSLSGLSSRPTTTELPTWVPDLNSRLTSRLRGINVRQLHHTTSVTSCIGGVARKSPSGIHITPQNELVIKGHLWDAVAETAHSGLNEVGKDLTGLARWLEMLSKLNSTVEQRRQALLCSLAETSSHEHSNESRFEEWLQFLCFTSIFGFRQLLRELDPALGKRDIHAHEHLEQPPRPIKTSISQAREYFSTLGYTLSSDTVQRWCGEGEYVHVATVDDWQWYRELTRDAMHYGQIVRDNNPTRRLLRTALTNILGTGPEETQPGDVIVLVEGVSVPYLLRRVRDGKFELIGEAYIHNLDVEEWLRNREGRGSTQELCIV
jgi:hypothetical protein